MTRDHREDGDERDLSTGTTLCDDGDDEYNEEKDFKSFVSVLVYVISWTTCANERKYLTALRYCITESLKSKINR